MWRYLRKVDLAGLRNVCVCQSTRGVAQTSLATPSTGSDISKKDEQPTLDIHFPWQMTPYKNFPRVLRPLKVRGCGRLSRYAAISVISYHTHQFAKEKLVASKFREAAAANIVAFTDAVDNMDVNLVNKSCVGELRKLVVTFLSVARNRSMDFRLHLINIDNVRLAGGSLLFFHNRFKLKKIVEDGVDAALFKHPLVKHPLMPFVNYFGEKADVRDHPPKALLMRMYVTFSTKEVYKIMQGSQVMFGSLEAKDSQHVATFERIIPCVPREKEGYFPPEPWHLTDMDSTVLKLQQAAKNTAPVAPTQ
eukprot:scpid23303/ scgid8961/ 